MIGKALYGFEERKDKRMRGKMEAVVRIGAVILFVLSVSCLYVGVRGIAETRPASDYQDEGVHTFVPCEFHPTQVDNPATGRLGRMNPTKTVYLVTYEATDATGYKWKLEASSRQEAERIVANAAPVERRVLSVRDDWKYITVEGDQTAEAYVSKQQSRYRNMIGASAACLVVFVVAGLVVWQKKRIVSGGRTR